MFKRIIIILNVIFCCFIISNSFATISQNVGKLLITEVTIKETNDWLELYVVDGSINWTDYRIYRTASSYYQLPANTYITGQYIVLHEESGTNQLIGNCWHFFDALGNGLEATDQNIFITNPGTVSTYVDALIYSDNDGEYTKYSSSKTKANDIVDDGLWDSYDFTTGDAGAWTDTDDINTGQTIARYLNASHTAYIDNNSKSDWYHCTTPSQGSANDSSLPVFLNSFSANVTQSGILLRWQTESEVNNAGFYICRSENKEGQFQRISPLIQGAGNTNELQKYDFIDHNVLEGKTYYYLIEDMDINGVVTKHKVISITYQTQSQKNNSPNSFEISPSYPNPFGEKIGNSATSIQLSISKDDVKNSFSIGIFNLLGQKVFQSSSNKLQVGEHIFNWSGLDDLGNRVGNGTYFWIIQSDKIYEVRRVTLLR
jgi:hypothetical protein